MPASQSPHAPPKVSIIMPTHDRAELLKEAIKSVLAQTYQNWELIIVDDGSTDDTSDVVEHYRRLTPRIQYIYQAQYGVSRARSRGLAFVQGTYVAFLDDDDLYLPKKLERQIAFLDAHPEAGLVYSSVEHVDLRTETSRVIPTQPARTFLELVRGCTIQTSSVLVRKTCFDQVGTFRGDLLGCDDYEMWLRIAKEYPIAFLPERVAVYRFHQSNLSYNWPQRYENLMNVFHGLLAKPGFSGTQRRAIRRSCARLSYTRASELVETGSVRQAAVYYAQAIRHNPAVGIDISWSRYGNWIYRSVRPYAAWFYCLSIGAFSSNGHGIAAERQTP